MLGQVSVSPWAGGELETDQLCCAAEKEAISPLTCL